MNCSEPIGLAENVYYLQTGPNHANAGFVVTGDGVVVVDTGPSPACGEAIKEAVASVTSEPIAYVINTHFHSSHSFGNQAFDVPVIAHAECRAQMERARDDEWSQASVTGWLQENPDRAEEYKNLEITLPAIAFSGSGFLHIGDTMVNLIHLGNHTPDSIAVFLPEQQVVFAGDNLFNGRHPFLRHANASQWVEVIRKLEKSRFEYAVPGHGRAMEAKDVHNLRVYFESLLKTPRRRSASHLIAQV